MKWFIRAVLMCALLGSIALNVALWNDLLPFPDRNSYIFTVRDDPAWKFAVKLLDDQFGMRPRFRQDTSGVKRAIYANGLILNVVDPALLKRLDTPAGGLGLPVNDPQAAATRLAAALKRGGYTGEIVDYADPTKFLIVKTNLFLSNVFVMRLPVIKLGKPDDWHP